MQCVFCQGQMREGQVFCPHCGRRQPTAQALPAAQAQPAVQTQPIPQTTPAQQPQAPAPQAVAAAAPLPRQQAGQPPKEARRALFLHFNEKPANIIAVMDQARSNQAEFVRQQMQRLRILALLLPAGSLFLLAYYVFHSQNLIALLLITYVLWGAALVGMLVLQRDWPSDAGVTPRGSPVGLIIPAIFVAVFLLFFGLWALVIGLVFLAPAFYVWIRLRRNRSAGEQFGPRFEVVHTAFETLKDDLAPGRTLIGWLDLTGAQQSGKVVQQRTSPSGMPVAFYRDEWLRLKMPLYDGNVLRLSAVERAKAKLGQWKRGRVSGKRKWKAGGTVWDRNELRVAVAVNPEAYEVLPIQRSQVGKFTVQTAQMGGHVAFRADTSGAIETEDILGVLRFAYEHLKPRGTAITAGGLT